MLADVREDMIKSLILTVPLEDLSVQMIDEIDAFADQQKGSARLKFVILDPEDNIYIEMFSRTKRMTISDQLIQYLESKPEIEFKLN